MTFLHVLSLVPILLSPLLPFCSDFSVSDFSYFAFIPLALLALFLACPSTEC